MNSQESKDKLVKHQEQQIKDLRKENLCLTADIKAAEDRWAQMQHEKDMMEEEYAKALELNKQLSEIIRFRSHA